MLHCRLWASQTIYFLLESITTLCRLISTTHYFPPGRYPVEAISIMSKICLEAEAATFHSNCFDELHFSVRGN